MHIPQEIIQHWILNTAFEIRRKLSDFVPFVEGLSLNVRDVPGAMPEDYAAGVLALLDSGSIRLYSDSDDGTEEIEASRDTVEAVLERRLMLPRESSRTRLTRSGPRRPPQSWIINEARDDLRWKLTPAGGEEWEKLAEPDWTRCLTMLTDQSSGDAWCADRDFLLAELGWCRELHFLDVDRMTIRLEVLHDHPITYWKCLPVVHHAAFTSKYFDSRWTVEHAGEPDPAWFLEWWISRNTRYKLPWTLPGWPKAI